MGLSSFNRMRREKAPVETIEAERFKVANELRQRQALDQVEAFDKNAERNEESFAAEHEAVERIGEKVREGMKDGVLDEPLRRDHAAEIAGRNIEGVQEPKDPVERIGERVPQSVTANEKLVPHTTVESDGPTKAQIDAAAKETGSLPAPPTANENVAPKGETETGSEEEPVEIPDDWEGKAWQTRVALAKRISGRDDVKTDEANEIIAAEVTRRG